METMVLLLQPFLHLRFNNGCGMYDPVCMILCNKTGLFLIKTSKRVIYQAVVGRVLSYHVRLLLFIVVFGLYLLEDQAR